MGKVTSDEQSCLSAPLDRRPRSGAPRHGSAAKKLTRFIPHNLLISMDSDERIQGNPRKSKSEKSGFWPLTGPVQENPNGAILRGLSLLAAILRLRRAAGDDVSLTELPGTGHLDLIDPLSSAWPRVMAAFAVLS